MPHEKAYSVPHEKARGMAHEKAHSVPHEKARGMAHEKACSVPHHVAFLKNSNRIWIGKHTCRKI